MLRQLRAKFLKLQLCMRFRIFNEVFLSYSFLRLENFPKVLYWDSIDWRFLQIFMTNLNRDKNDMQDSGPWHPQMSFGNCKFWVLIILYVVFGFDWNFLWFSVILDEVLCFLIVGVSTPSCTLMSLKNTETHMYIHVSQFFLAL